MFSGGRHILGHLWGFSQGKPSAVQTDPCNRDNAVSALWAQTSELSSSSLWKCLFKRAVPPSVCSYVLVCVMKAINIQHVHAWERDKYAKEKEVKERDEMESEK